ncbi:EutN/CcmL family microcompartment protein [Niallia sp. JL1B1071]|uniref:EutN/CcmL family microcompartment protein n=1 Tax=Niallia hominis TaxID=3133173 RepID=A0ABV1EY74_9BACI
MHIGKVVGNVVSTKKEETLTGFKLMIVELINHKNEGIHKELVAVDLVGAGRGEYVLVATGSSARVASGQKDAPIDATIVGIVDTFE